MTEVINNRLQRNKALRSVIVKLQQGSTPEEVRDEFREIIHGLSPAEISAVESQLIAEGMPESEVKRLCDVHVMAFKEHLDILPRLQGEPGHPIHTFVKENEEIANLTSQLRQMFTVAKESNKEGLKWAFLTQLNLLMDVEKHYDRKEMLLFPILEQHGFEGPSKVMWGIHDDIRRELKKLKEDLTKSTIEQWISSETPIDLLLEKIDGMIYKEEKILLPTAAEMLTEDEWVSIAKESEAYGYCIYVPEVSWQPENLLSLTFDEIQSKSIDGLVNLGTGRLGVEQLKLLFSHLPVDITLVDEEDTVVFFTHGRSPVFTRTKAILGRKVQNCHPPNSFDRVEEILQAFKNNTRDLAEFWIDFKETFVYICFYAIRDDTGRYKGTMEVVMDASHIRGLKGEKRILDPL